MMSDYREADRMPFGPWLIAYTPWLALDECRTAERDAMDAAIELAEVER